MTFRPERLEATLEALLGSVADERFAVAFSGGLDSTVLLASMARLYGGWREAGHGSRLRAIHVDHGADPASAGRAAACRRAAAGFGVHLTVLRLRHALPRGASLEAHLRDVRYSGLVRNIEQGEVVLSAHHLDDQAETVLLQLLRGAGPAGVAAMPVISDLPPGRLCRPLLDVPRADLEAWARAEGLAWLEDPANEDERLHRNYLRREILPRLVQAWPGAVGNLARSARHMADATELLEAMAEGDLAAAGSGNRLWVDAVKALPQARQRNLLRHWIRQCGRPLPDTRRLEAVRLEVLPAAEDAEPRVTWPGAEIRRYDGWLYALPPLAEPPPKDRALTWNPEVPLELGEGLGRLVATPHSEGQIDAARLRAGSVEVRWRVGGERIRPAAGGSRRVLKKLMQEARILPWMRERIPLVYVDGALAAVGDLWFEAGLAPSKGASAVRLRWEDRPDLG